MAEVSNRLEATFKQIRLYKVEMRNYSIRVVGGVQKGDANWPPKVQTHQRDTYQYIVVIFFFSR